MAMVLFIMLSLICLPTPGIGIKTKQQGGPTNTVLETKRLDVAHALLQLLQFLLEVGIFLGHFFVLGLPLVSSLF